MWNFRVEYWIHHDQLLIKHIWFKNFVTFTISSIVRVDVDHACWHRCSNVCILHHHEPIIVTNDKTMKQCPMKRIWWTFEKHVFYLLWVTFSNVFVLTRLFWKAFMTQISFKVETIGTSIDFCMNFKYAAPFSPVC